MLERAIPISPRHQRLFPKWRGDVPFRPRLAPVREALLARHEGLADCIAANSFEAFERAHVGAPQVHGYRWVADPARAMVEAMPEALRAPWLCALLIELMTRSREAFANSGLNREFALHYTDCFHRMLDEIERGTGFADLSRDAFLKDLWIARIVMIPAFASILWPRAGLSAKAVVRGGGAAVAYVLRDCRGRRPMLEGHTHDPMARAYWNERGWHETLRLAALAMMGLPRIRGTFGIAWYYDPAVIAITPNLAFTQDKQLAHGAIRFRIGTNRGTIGHALAASAARRNRYRDGSYMPTDYAILWSRRALIAAYGPNGTALGGADPVNTPASSA